MLFFHSSLRDVLAQPGGLGNGFEENGSTQFIFKPRTHPGPSFKKTHKISRAANGHERKSNYFTCRHIICMQRIERNVCFSLCTGDPVFLGSTVSCKGVEETRFFWKWSTDRVLIA